MRVELVNKFLDDRGGDTTAVHLLRGWLQERGHEVFLFGTWPPTPPGASGTAGMTAAADRPHAGAASGAGEFPDADLFPAPLPPNGAPLSRAAALYRISAGAALARAVERRRPDVLHFHNIHYHLSGAIVAAARQHGVPVVWTLHDVNLFCPNISGCRDGRPCMECHVSRFHRCVAFNCRGDLAASVAAAAEAYLFRALGLWRDIARFIAPSRFTRLLLETHGVGPERVALVEPALDLARFAAPPEGGGGFLYLGRLSPEKGVEVLIEAVGRLPRTRLQVAGDGPLRPALERLAEERAPGRVKFLGRLSREEAARALACCEALVLPSVCLEVAPLALLEAAAAARAVVASRVGGVPEWVDDGETGLLVPCAEVEPLAEALAALADSPQRARRLGEQARERARRRYDPAVHCDTLEGVYRRAAAR